MIKKYCEFCGEKRNGLDEDEGLMAHVCSTPKKEPSWFTADKPLPDGWYGWRREDINCISIRNVSDGSIYFHGYLGEDFSGEWFKIEFPD